VAPPSYPRHNSSGGSYQSSGPRYNSFNGSDPYPPLRYPDRASTAPNSRRPSTPNSTSMKSPKPYPGSNRPPPIPGSRGPRSPPPPHSQRRISSDERRKYPYPHGPPPPPHRSSTSGPSRQWDRPRSRERDWDWRNSRATEWDHWDSRRDRGGHYHRDDYRDRERDRERDRDRDRDRPPLPRARRRSFSAERDHQQSTDSGRRSISNESQPPQQPMAERTREQSIPPTKPRSLNDDDLFPHRVRQSSDGGSSKARSPSFVNDRSKSPTKPLKKEEYSKPLEQKEGVKPLEQKEEPKPLEQKEGEPKPLEQKEGEPKPLEQKEESKPLDQKEESKPLEQKAVSSSPQQAEEKKPTETELDSHAENNRRENKEIQGSVDNTDTDGVEKEGQTIKTLDDGFKTTTTTTSEEVVQNNVETEDVEMKESEGSSSVKLAETDKKGKIDEVESEPKPNAEVDKSSLSLESNTRMDGEKEKDREEATKVESATTRMDTAREEAEAPDAPSNVVKDKAAMDEKMDATDEKMDIDAPSSNLQGGAQVPVPSTDDDSTGWKNVVDDETQSSNKVAVSESESKGESLSEPKQSKVNKNELAGEPNKQPKPEKPVDDEVDDDHDVEMENATATKLSSTTEIPLASDRPVAVAKDVIETDDDGSVESIEHDLKAGIVRFPLNRMEQALYDVKIIPIDDRQKEMKYLRRSPGGKAFKELVRRNNRWFEKSKQELLSQVEAHEAKVEAEKRHLTNEYFDIRKSWLKFCADTDREVSERTLESRGGESRTTNPTTPHLPQPPPSSTESSNNFTAVTTANNNTSTTNDRNSRRSRAMAGDTVRSEAEFLEILANLERESARDPTMRANLTSAVIPGMIIDSVEREKYRFKDTNTFVVDKSVPYQRLIADAVDPFTPEEHEAFCEAYALYPKQFGKIARVMSKGRTYNECVLHYYQTKKTVDYKGLVASRSKRSSRRGKRKQAPKEKVITTPGGTRSVVTDQEDAENDSGTSAPATSIPQNEENPFETLAAAAVATANTAATNATAATTATTTTTTTATTTTTTVATGRSSRKSGGADGDEIGERKRSQDEVVTTTTESKKKNKTTATAKTRTSSGTTGGRKSGGRAKKDDPDDAESGDAQATPPIPPREKVSSYWSLGEVATFEKLLPQYGTHWEDYAKHLKYKSLIMLKNFFMKHASDRGYDEIAAKANAEYDENNKKEPPAQPQGVPTQQPQSQPQTQRQQEQEPEQEQPPTTTKYGAVTPRQPPPPAQPQPQEAPTRPEAVSAPLQPQLAQAGAAHHPAQGGGPTPGYFSPRVGANGPLPSNAVGPPPPMQPVSMFPQHRPVSSSIQTAPASSTKGPPSPPRQPSPGPLSGPKLPPISNLEIGNMHRQSGTPPPSAPQAAPRPVIKPPRKSSISSILNNPSPGEIKNEGTPEKNMLPPLGSDPRVGGSSSWSGGGPSQFSSLPIRSYSHSPVQQPPPPPPPAHPTTVDHTPLQPPVQQQQPPYQQSSLSQRAPYLYGYGDFSTPRESNERGVGGYGIPPTSNVRK
jgi:hypothetical protein